MKLSTILLRCSTISSLRSKLLYALRHRLQIVAETSTSLRDIRPIEDHIRHIQCTPWQSLMQLQSYVLRHQDTFVQLLNPLTHEYKTQNRVGARR